MPGNSDGETKVVSRQTRSGETKIPVTIRPVLKVLEGPGRDLVFRIEHTQTIVGRGHDADFRIDDDAISRHHFLVRFQDMEFRVRDLDSANGTILNGSKVTEYALRHNDRIVIGETMLQFAIDRI